MTAPDRFVAGALDLGEVKARAEARAEAEHQSTASGRNTEASNIVEVAASFVVTANNFENDVLQRSVQVPVFLLVGTPRSEDSEQLRVDLTALVESAQLRWLFGYLDADTYPEVAQVLGVRSLPTVVVLAAGRPVTSFAGAQPRGQLENVAHAVVQQIGSQLRGLPDGVVQAGSQPYEESESKQDPRLDVAQDAMTRGDYAKAAELYDALLSDNPGDAELTRARAAVMVHARVAESGKTMDEAVAAADKVAGSVPDALLAADAEVCVGNPQAGFDRLVALLRQSSGPEKDVVRARLVELLGLFDPANPMIIESRQAMASALY